MTNTTNNNIFTFITRSPEFYVHKFHRTIPDLNVPAEIAKNILVRDVMYDIARYLLDENAFTTALMIQLAPIHKVTGAFGEILWQIDALVCMRRNALQNAPNNQNSSAS